MLAVEQTNDFAAWLGGLRDDNGRRRIIARLVRLQSGSLGDHRSVGGKVSELRIDAGPGYRVYFTKRGRTVILLLCGGDKDTQARDIEKAKEMAAQLE